MKNLKKFRRAMVSSVVSIALCFTALLGTTFAWFSDSVSNKINTI